MSSDFELNNSDFEEDRYSRLRLIPWWDQDRLKNATIMVVGAGTTETVYFSAESAAGISRTPFKTRRGR
jgi:hypothetical protein